MLDLRLPIGWFFVINSAVLLIWGMVSPSQTPLGPGQQINLNLTWGAVLGVFGVIMVALAKFNKQA
jgi:quinol-cytochrome oxidoreductase complex cytochrome b subunit